jgi:hypothetical protein
MNPLCVVSGPQRVPRVFQSRVYNQMDPPVCLGRNMPFDMDLWKGLSAFLCSLIGSKPVSLVSEMRSSGIVSISPKMLTFTPRLSLGKQPTCKGIRLCMPRWLLAMAREDFRQLASQSCPRLTWSTVRGQQPAGTDSGQLEGQSRVVETLSLASMIRNWAVDLVKCLWRISLGFCLQIHFAIAPRIAQ